MAATSPPSRGSLSKSDHYDLEANAPEKSVVGSTDPSTPPQVATQEKDAESTASQDDEFTVWWSEPANQDPENPMNWSSRKKWGIIAILSAITFLTPLASSMFAPGVPMMMADFGTSSSLVAGFVVSVFVLGFAFGPLLLAPLSEMYGRTIVYHVCNGLFVVFTIACAVAKDVGSLIVFRFFAGFAGVAVVTCGSGSIADIMPREKRGGAMALWSLGPLLGPIIGPVAAGFLVEAMGWRWVFWIVAIVSGAVILASVFILRETYAPVILERKAARLRNETGNPNYRSKLASNLTQKQVFMQSIVRPLKLLFLSPIVAAMCVYVAVVYGELYILFTTFTFVYEDIYQFSPRGAGLSFIASGVGTMIGLGYSGRMSDLVIRKKMAAKQEVKPEDRLSLLITVPATLTLPIGLIMYGWTVDKHVHWIAPMIGTGIMGFGMIAILMCVQTYLVDAFTQYAASVIAANAVLRSLLGATLPLCGLDMYDKLGLGWGNTLLGLIALGLAPVPWLLAAKGEAIRTKPRWQVKL